MGHISTVFYQTVDILSTIKAHVFTKSIFTGIATVCSVLFGEENYELLGLLFLLIMIDLITGMIASVSLGQPIESRRAFKTATKAFVYLLFFSAAYLTAEIVPHSDFITTGVLSFLAITELLSVVENMAKMGYSIPLKLLNQIKGDRFPVAEKKKNSFGSGS